MKTDLSQEFAALFRDIPLQRLFANMNARAEVLNIDGLDIPCTVIDRITPNCYTASPHSAIVDYARDELVKLPGGQRMLAAGLLSALSGILRLNQIDRMVTLNNYCLSTNSFSEAFQTTPMSKLTQAAVAKWPKHALSVRSLNPRQHKDLIERLEQLGWKMVVTRQVYIMDDWQAVRAKTNTKRDRKIFNDGRYVFERLSADSPDADFEAAVHWYNRLYLNKYSKQNVQFTVEFMREAVSRDILNLFLLRDGKTGESAGVSGVVIDSNTATSPIVGYDDAKPQSDALYRRCMTRCMQTCIEADVPLNFSSGAPDFKRVRGAVPEIEYMAVYTSHLRPARRLIWKLLHALSQGYYKKILIKYKL